jgi:hypothetical protein
MKRVWFVTCGAAFVVQGYTQGDCLAYDENGVETKGDCENGKGYLSYDDGDYDGEWKEGKKDGKGVRMWFGDKRYDGEWKDGEQHGHGVFTDGDDKYDGEWKAGKKHGKGVLYNEEDGSHFDGEWKDGEHDTKGKGVYTKADGSKLPIGCQQGDCENGNGVETYPGGGNYDGEWKSSMRHGKGVLSGDPFGKGVIAVYYDGEWKNDNFHGKGTVYYDGPKYNGEWKDGAQHGKGIRTNADGTVEHDGEWRNGEKHGASRNDHDDTVEYDSERMDTGFNYWEVFVLVGLVLSTPVLLVGLIVWLASRYTPKTKGTTPPPKAKSQAKAKSGSNAKAASRSKSPAAKSKANARSAVIVKVLRGVVLSKWVDAFNSFGPEGSLDKQELAALVRAYSGDGLAIEAMLQDSGDGDGLAIEQKRFLEMVANEDGKSSAAWDSFAAIMADSLAGVSTGPGGSSLADAAVPCQQYLVNFMLGNDWASVVPQIVDICYTHSLSFWLGLFPNISQASHNDCVVVLALIVQLLKLGLAVFGGYCWFFKATFAHG